MLPVVIWDSKPDSLLEKVDFKALKRQCFQLSLGTTKPDSLLGEVYFKALEDSAFSCHLGQQNQIVYLEK